MMTAWMVEKPVWVMVVEEVRCHAVMSQPVSPLHVALAGVEEAAARLGYPSLELSLAAGAVLVAGSAHGQEQGFVVVIEAEEEVPVER